MANKDNDPIIPEDEPLNMDRLDDMMDDDFDLDFDPDQPPKERSPIEEFGSGLKDAASDFTLDSNVVARETENAFPKTSRLVQSSIGVVSDISNIKDRALKDLSPTINQLKQTTNRLLPRMKPLLPTKAYSFLEDKMSPGYKMPRIDKKKLQEDAIAASLASVFDTQEKIRSEEEQRKTADKYIDRALDRTYQEEDLHLLNAIRQQVQLQSTFTTSVLKNALMKSLELKYRHLFVAKETLSVTKGFAKTLDSKLTTISHNTALPDIQKKRKLEAVKEFNQDVLIGKVTSTVGDWTSGFRSNVMAKLQDYVSAKVSSAKDVLSEISDGIEMYSDAVEMEDEMGLEPDSKAKKAGTMLGKMGLTFGSQRLLRKALMKLKESGIDIDNMSDDIRQNLIFTINDKIRESNGEGFWGWMENFIDTLSPERGGIAKTLEKNAMEEIPFDVLTRRSIVEIIPGYLSKILKVTTDIHTGGDSPEVVYDVSKEKFTTADEFRETLYNRYFGTADERSREMSESVGKLLGAYTIQGGDSKQFNDSMEDVVKFLNNSAKHLQTVKPKIIEKLYSGEELTDPEQEYIDWTFKDVEDRENLVSVLRQALHSEDDDAKEVRAAKVDLNKSLMNLGKKRDDRLIKLMAKQSALGTRRLHEDIMTERGNISHDKIREIYSDVKLDDTAVADQAKAYITRRAELGSNAVSKDDIDEIKSRLDTITEEEPYSTDAKIQKAMDEYLAGDISTADHLKKTLSDVKDKLDEGKGLSDPGLKDVSHVSGPGVYVQESAMEAHIPLDELNNPFWENLSTVIHDKSHQLTEDKVSSTTDVILTNIYALLSETLPNLTAIASGDPKVGRSIASSLKSGTKSLINVGSNMAKSYIGFTTNLMSGLSSGAMKTVGNLNIPELIGSVTSGAASVIGGVGSMYGGALRGIGNKLGGAKDKAISALSDIYAKGGEIGNPLVTLAQLKKGLIFKDGTLIKDIRDITEPVYDPETMDVVISQNDIDNGLMTIDGTPINDLARKGKSLVSKGVEGLFGAGKRLFDLGTGGIAGIGGIYGKMLNMSLGGISGIGSTMKELVHKKLGLGDYGQAGSIDKETLQEYVSNRLDAIYNLLVERMPKPEVEGSYEDYLSDRAAEKKKITEKKEEKTEKKTSRSRMAKMAAAFGGVLGFGKGKDKDADDDDDGILGSAAELALGGSGTAVAASAVDDLIFKGKGKAMLGAAKDKIASKFGKKGAAKAGEAAAKKPGLLTKVGKGIGSIASKGASLLGKSGSMLGKASKYIGKSAKGLGILGKKVPLLGALIGTGFAINSLIKGDVTGAGLEMASGLASTFLPIGGQAISLALDAMIIGRELSADDFEHTDIKNDTTLPVRMKIYRAPENKLQETLKLETWSYKKLEKQEPVTQEELAAFAKAFGLDPSEEKQMNFFYTWYRNRFMKAVIIFNNISTQLFDKNIHEVGSLDKEQQKTIAETFVREAAKEISLDLRYVPAKAAFVSYLNSVEKGIAPFKAQKVDAKVETEHSQLQDKVFTKKQFSKMIQEDDRDFNKVIHLKNHTKIDPIFGLRLQAYGVSDNTELHNTIYELEKWTDFYLKRKAMPLVVDAAQQATWFKFDASDKTQANFFSTWYMKRFLPVYQTAYSLAQTFGTDIDNIENMSSDVKEEYMSKFASEVNKLQCDLDIVPTNEAFLKYKAKLPKTSVNKGVQKRDDKDETFYQKTKRKVLSFLGFSDDSDSTSDSGPKMAESDTYLGDMVMKYESGKKGSSAIGYDRKGGTSYGRYQLSSNAGTFDEFLEWVSTQPGGKEVAERLRMAGASNTGSKTGAVPNEWKKLVKEGKLQDFEHEFIKKTHYDVAFKKLDNEVKDFVNQNRVLQEALWSAAVQHGPGRADDFFNDAYEEGITVPDYLKKVFEMRGAPDNFKSSTAEVVASVQDRFNREADYLISQIDQGETAKESLSNININAPDVAAPDTNSGVQKIASKMQEEADSSIPNRVAMAKADEAKAVESKAVEAVAKADAKAKPQDTKVEVTVNPDKEQIAATKQQTDILNRIDSSIAKLSSTIKDSNTNMTDVVANAVKGPTEVRIDASQIAAISNQGQSHHQGISLRKRA